MGLSTALVDPVQRLIAAHSLSVLIPAGFAAFVVVAIVLNVLNQLLFKNPNEPPVVFHWVPLIGNTITYGMEPFKFFSSCREKVWYSLLCARGSSLTDLLASMATYSHLSSWEGKSPCAWERRVMNSS